MRLRACDLRHQFTGMQNLTLIHGADLITSKREHHYRLSLPRDELNLVRLVAGISMNHRSAVATFQAMGVDVMPQNHRV